MMKEKEKIDWGLLAFVFVFCWCLKLGMYLDLKNPTYPNDLNAYQEKMLPERNGCAFGMLQYNFDSQELNFRNFDGDIR